MMCGLPYDVNETSKAEAVSIHREFKMRILRDFMRFRLRTRIGSRPPNELSGKVIEPSRAI